MQLCALKFLIFSYFTDRTPPPPPKAYSKKLRLFRRTYFQPLPYRFYFLVICLQVIKSHVISSCRDHQLSVFDPSLGTLGNQMRRLNLDEWLAAFDHLLRVLFLMCRRVQSIQELILENIDRFGDVVPQDNREHSLPATADRCNFTS